MTETLHPEYQEVVDNLLSKSAEGVTVLEMAGLDAIAETFVIATANSDVHMQTLLQVCEEALDQKQMKYTVEGARSSMWTLIDAGSIVVHIFSGKGRDYYRLENIWGDAKVLTFDDTPEDN